MNELKYIIEQGGAYALLGLLIFVFIRVSKIISPFLKKIFEMLEKFLTNLDLQLEELKEQTRLQRKQTENHFTHIEEYTKETRDIMVEHNKISKENSEKQIEILNEIKNKL